jgi:PHD/YefM family antitoxin component YafN of YafNO toxin-antitoxin module
MSETTRSGKHQTEWITISIDEYESMKRTIEILSDKDLMNQIEEGKKKDVKVFSFEDIASELEI